METENVLELQHITKTFGQLVAVDDVDFALQAGEIHAILGENGAGKSTLMNLIYGLYQPSAGSISVSGEPKIFRSPRDAIANGIGMVHQHFMLIENLTVAENIALSFSQLRSTYRTTEEAGLGLEIALPSTPQPPLSGGQTAQPPLSGGQTSQPPLSGGQKGKKSNIFHSLLPRRFKKAEAVEITEALSERFGLTVDANALVRTLSVGLKQRVEILKALAVEARILILDEPTAVLSPQEVNGFFTILRKLIEDNRSIIFISHKMKEVLEISDRITVLRRGKKVYLGKTGELTARELAREMLGEPVAELEQTDKRSVTDTVLQISDLTVLGSRDEVAVADLSMAAHRGEIVGIAGVDGNGQRELAEAIMGLRPIASGRIEILSMEPRGTKAIRLQGVSYIPEDRQTMGVIASFSVMENLLLNVRHLADVAKRGIIKQRTKKRLAEHLIAEYDIRPPSAYIPASSLSGGNQQKVVLAREMESQPELLIAVNPTRGLDISAAHYVHQNLLSQRDQKKSVLLISTELDEVLQLSDRLYVMSRGTLIEATEHRENIEALGLLMTGEANTDG